MSTVAVVVVVVGACIGVVTSVMTRTVEPATDRARDQRVRPPAAVKPEPADRIRWWQRLRSAVLLSVLSVVLGLATAAAVGLAAIALFGLLRGAVG